MDISSSPPRVLSLTAPMTQLNTPYPSTAYITGFLRSRGIAAVQEDLALALALKLLSRPGLLALRDAGAPVSEDMLATIDPTIAFLQGRDSTLAHRICSRAFLPEGRRFQSLEVYVDDD